MLVCTDNRGLAARLLAEDQLGWESPAKLPGEIDEIVERLCGSRRVFVARASSQMWSHLFVVETAPESQYDALIDLSRQGVALPTRLLCFAATGEHFHGFRDRPWSTAAGNIHLSARFAPPGGSGDATIGLLALAAVSVVDAIDAIPGLENRAGIKWVNDILIDGAKVCGILAHTEALSHRVTAGIVGIGLNVETTPEVAATPFVPHVASLRDFDPDPGACDRDVVFRALSNALARNYGRLIDGGYEALLDRYRGRSIAIGRQVAVCKEESGTEPEIVARGRVTGLGNRLELLLEGASEPINRGRLILDPQSRHQESNSHPT
jgi:BirA family biotin operon repressor/biotin-[acetyl-CoA-carboxylase] ligase